MERNTSWGMLTTLNGNCSTLLFKDLYESKSNWSEWWWEWIFLTQSLSTEHNDEIVTAVQVLFLKVNISEHLNVVLRLGMMSD